ncbi:MAG: hypothetical protein MJ156_01460 [Alphaproteobacteria bacterium]|nr:hypothetical protein [Alphaproteobacteria bacterium]
MPNTTYYTNIYNNIVKNGWLSAGILAYTYCMTSHNVTNILRNIYIANPEVILYEPALHKNPFFLINTPEAKNLFRTKLAKNWLSVPDLAELYKISSGTARSIVYKIEKSNPDLVKREPYKGGFIVLLQNTPKALGIFRKQVQPPKEQWISTAVLSVKYKLRSKQAVNLLKTLRKTACSNVYCYTCKSGEKFFSLKNTPEAIALFENMIFSPNFIPVEELMKKHNLTRNRAYAILRDIEEQYPESVHKQKDSRMQTVKCLNKTYLDVFADMASKDVLIDRFLCNKYNLSEYKLKCIKNELQQLCPEVLEHSKKGYGLKNLPECIAEFEKCLRMHTQQHITGSDWRTINMLCVKYGIRQKKVAPLLEKMQSDVPESVQECINEYGDKEICLSGKYVEHFEQLLKKPILTVVQLSYRYGLSYGCVLGNLMKLRAIMPTDIFYTLKKEGGRNFVISVRNTPEVLDKLDQCFKHKKVKEMLQAARMVGAQNVR